MKCPSILEVNDQGQTPFPSSISIAWGQTRNLSAIGTIGAYRTF
jgi:hypothetical protein